jgi:undecaprenyl-diphosphatase
MPGPFPAFLRAAFALARREIVLLAFVFAAGAFVLVFGNIAEEVLEGDTSTFDESALLFFRNPADPSDPIGPRWFEEAARDVTALGSYTLLIFFVVAASIYFLILRRFAEPILLFAGVFGGALLSDLLKTGFARPRPDLVPHLTEAFSPSFPSGHAMASAITYLTIGALLARTTPNPLAKTYVLVLAVLLTFLVGLSRIYLGVHYPSDVLAGWCIGAAWAALCWGIALRLGRRGAA